MRMTAVLVSLGLLLVGSRADSSGPVMPRPGGIVGGSPVAPTKVERLPADYSQVPQLGHGYIGPTSEDRVVWAAKGVIEEQFRAAGWADHDSNNAVVSFVVDTPDGWAMLNQAVKKLGIPGGSPSDVDPVIQQIGYSAGRRGLVQVVSDPAEVSVLLGKTVKGITQLEFWCAAGRHQLTLHKPGYKSQTMTITVHPQQLTPVKAQMAKP